MCKWLCGTRPREDSPGSQGHYTTSTALVAGRRPEARSAVIFMLTRNFAMSNGISLRMLFGGPFQEGCKNPGLPTASVFVTNRKRCEIQHLRFATTWGSLEASTVAIYTAPN